MPVPPKQARSVQSADRMLEAAEALLREGGPRAITIEAVIARAGTSMGSFYARFERRDGLFRALHQRFLAMVVREDLLVRLDRAASEPDLARAVHSFVTATFVHAADHRDLTAFFMVYHNGDRAMREDGAAMSRAFSDLLHRLVKAHRAEVSHKNLRVASDFAALLIAGVNLERLIHEPGEFTGRAQTTKQVINSTSQAVVAYLRFG